MEKVADILLKIVETKKREVENLRGRCNEFKARATSLPPALDFPAAISTDNLAVIAEIKKASPSAGIISASFDPEAVAEAYAKGGANAVSVLTDREYFKGDPGYIPLVRPLLPGIPVLRKDFIIDPVQIHEARSLGADTFLLIAAILETSQLRDFIELGRELGMEPLVESHTLEELEKSRDAGTKIFGINNRNLHNFTVDLATSENLCKEIPADSVAVSESGIKVPEDAARMKRAGFNAILVGETLMRHGIEGCPDAIKHYQESR